jgi:hypothetical protein
MTQTELKAAHLGNRIGWAKEEVRDSWASFFAGLGLQTRQSAPGYTMVDPEEGEDGGDGETETLYDFGLMVNDRVFEAWSTVQAETKATRGLSGPAKREFRQAALRRLLA